MRDDTLIDEPVKVWAFFDPSSRTKPILPIAIKWHSRLIKFQKVIFTSSKRVGEIRIINIICETSGANFQLEYNNESYLWRLKKIMPKD